jgi:hypothetical protein
LLNVQELPRNAAIRKVNELVKRARMAKVHALIIGHLRAKMPFFGQQAAQKKLIDSMGDEFYEVMKKYRLPAGDFPAMAKFNEVAGTYDFSKFKKLDEKMLQGADDALGSGIPALLTQLGDEMDARASRDKASHDTFMESGIGSAISNRAGMEAPRTMGRDSAEPTSGPALSGAARDAYATWSVVVNKPDADAVFKMQPGGMSGKLSGADAKDVLLDSGLDVGVLRQVWDLGDIDKDGFLDKDEFAVVWYLMNSAKAGKAIPATLPANLVPPGKVVS